MNYRRFLSYDICGGFFWVWSMVLLGYSLGSAVPDIDRHIHIVIAVVILLSLSPAFIEMWKHRRKARKEKSAE
jgi:membrane-associated protein